MPLIMRPNIRNRSNIILQKSEVGKSRPGIGNLPPEDFRYGRSSMKNDIATTEVIFARAMSAKSPLAEPPTDFRKVNRFALPRQISN